MVDASVDPCALLESLQLDVDSFDRLADAVLESFTTRQRFIQFLDEYRRKVEQGQGDPVKLGLGYLVLDRWSEALEWFAKAPDGKFRRFYAAKSALALGRYDAALSEFDQAAAKGWDRFSTDMLSATILIRKGDVAAAEKLAQKHAQAGRDRADWYYVQGLLREHADEWAAAADQYEHALTLEPHHAPATFRCAWLYDIHGDDERAIELYQRLVLQPRAHVNALMNLAVIYEDIGEYDDALECIQRVLKAYPNHTRARLFLKDVESCWGMVLEEPGDTPADSGTRLLDTAISEFELSVRARNCLKKMNIRTLGDLVRLNEVELLSFKNFGETSLSEIKALLAKRGLRLGQPTEEAPAPETPAEPGTPPPPRVVVPPGRESILSRPVSELELSVRARRCLQRLNVNSLNDLIQLTEADLLAARNFGVTSLNEVKARLTEHGLQLAPSAASNETAVRDGFAFRVLHTDGRARRALLTTPHGPIDTPAFMPVGTQASVKGLTPNQLVQTGTQLVLANTYHLMIRPDADVVQTLGGLHRFMSWPGPILTDSGGFQVFSLADLRRVDDEGADFRSHVDGAPLRLTPESSMDVQSKLGADIIMAFDECPALPAEPRVLRDAVRRTVAWAARCRTAHKRPDQALYGIIQGGTDLALRRECLAQLVEIGFDGYAIGGLSVGEPPPEMWACLDDFAHALPADRPRYVMGVGQPRDLVRAVAAGVDQFDCVLPTRNGRKGYVFTSTGPLRLRNACHRLADAPLDPPCRCYTCQNFSRGYLRHLFMVGEVLGGTLVSLHNIAFYQDLMRQMREQIASGTFAAWQRTFLETPACQITAEGDE